ncbi:MULTISPECIES: STAS domain-containing protein [Streptomyces]|uniref:Anti-sigma factor antagonist n=1 Tax=Streptomyces koelreuteriae TaxID=2838015 RepID=A0ABX8FKC1_9ACTN|nr:MULTISPECIES: STAS domain-containing protein [Streptomyces]QWB21558.1 STAS domain-containing protein [Streptomyces koelreuteriae]UUA04480.1 STAS domain-containing protein [Streptomyces koelreuteriae]UUA12105.1 STAS domain-containing protein [Streptomyces sp. CRCS-T-1]
MVPLPGVRRSEDCGGWAVVVLTGEVDRALAPALREAVDALIVEDRARIVLDLEQVPFMDSSGLSALVYGARRAGALGGTLRLAAPRDQVRRLLELTGLSTAVEVFPGVRAACEAPCP